MSVKQKRYVVTAGQFNSDVNPDVYETMMNYCKHNDARLIVGQLSGKNVYEHYWPEALRDNALRDALGDNYFVLRRKNYHLNRKIKVRDERIKPQQILPLTGMDRFTQQDVTTIYPGSKQHMRAIANSVAKVPKFLMTTGAITLPNYNLKHRQGNIALNDHTYGAVLVELENNVIYHFRYLSFLKNGKVTDLGTLYDGNSIIERIRPEAMVLGDWHAGPDQDLIVRAETLRMIERYNPKRLIIHDLHNNDSTNHHNQNKLIEQVIAYDEGKYCLEDELQNDFSDLEKLSEITSDDTEIIVVKSNHDEGLERYLNEGRFLKEPHNAKISVELLREAFRDNDPLEEGIKLVGGKIPDKVRFLRRDEDYKVMGWQLGRHGDKGPNGSRGSMYSKEKSYGKSITGHSHTPHILRNTYVVGTMTKLRLRYNKGNDSSWMHTHGFLWPNRKVQLVNIMNGHHRLETEPEAVEPTQTN